MTHQVQHTAAGEGIELTAPDAVLTIKIDGGHTDDHYELFEVDAPRPKFLAISMSGAMGRFHADLDATIPRDRPLEEVTHEIRQVLSRHDVVVAGLDAAGLGPVS